MTAASPPGHAGLWVGLAVGGPVIAFGVAGAVGDAASTHPAELARWVVGGALVHDLVLAPIVLGVSWLLGRLAGRRARRPALGPVRWAMATSAVLVLFAWPFVRGYGRNPGVPSLLNRDYGAGLVAYLVAVWAVAALAVLVALAVLRYRTRHP